MDLSHGSESWIWAMDLSHGSEPWIWVMDLMHLHTKGLWSRLMAPPVCCKWPSAHGGWCASDCWAGGPTGECHWPLSIGWLWTELFGSTECGSTVWINRIVGGAVLANHSLICWIVGGNDWQGMNRIVWINRINVIRIVGECMSIYYASLSCWIVGGSDWQGMNRIVWINRMWSELWSELMWSELLVNVWVYIMLSMLNFPWTVV